eukprot:1373682-Rhodomonas_salina.3
MTASLIVFIEDMMGQQKFVLRTWTDTATAHREPVEIKDKEAHSWYKLHGDHTCAGAPGNVTATHPRVSPCAGPGAEEARFRGLTRKKPKERIRAMAAAPKSPRRLEERRRVVMVKLAPRSRSIAPCRAAAALPTRQTKTRMLSVGCRCGGETAAISDQ